MTTMLSGSGAVTAVLQSYEKALQAILQACTGDPGAVRASAQRCAQWQQQLSSNADTVTQTGDALGSNWTGDAYDAFHRANTDNATTSRGVGSSLGEQADELNRKAGALEQAHNTIQQVITWFEQNGQMYANIAASSPQETAQCVQAAQQLGERAVEMANQSKSWLGTQLAGFESEGATLWDASHTLQTGGQFFWNGLMGQGTAALQYGPKLTGNAELSNNGLDLKGNFNLLDGHLNGSLTDGQNTVTGDLEATVGADGKLVVSPSKISGDFKAGGEIKGSIEDSTKYGDVTVSSKTEGDAFAGIKGELNGEDGKTGLQLGATASVTQTESVEAGGVKLGFTGGYETGAGGDASVTAGYDNGHLKLGFDAGGAFGEGAKVGANLDIDVPKVGGEIKDGATWLWNGAGSAASSIGDAMSNAIQHPFGL